MNSKKFEYYHRDVPQLKKDIVVRCFFSVIFLATFIWQIANIITENSKTSPSIMQIIVSVIVLISSLILFCIVLLYAFKDFRIIGAIKMQGKCVSSVNILFSTKKSGFLKLYSLLIQFLTLATSLVLIACVTYSILQIAYLNSISFYMPMLLLICMSGYSSIYHIKDEIHTQKNVQMQQPEY